MDQDPGAHERPKVIAAIQALLKRRGIPDRKHLTALEAALGLDYNKVRRRMSGETSWAVGEVARIATHFGEPVFSLLGALVDEVGRPATLQVGGLALPCSIWVVPAQSPERRIGPLLAVATDGSEQLTVLPMAEVGDRPAFEIRRLIFEASAPRRVAVVDDDDDLCSSIVEFLRHKGLDAVSYRTEDHVRTALETTMFDAFILDWVLEHGNVKDLMAAIRAKNPTGPIVILTGQLGTEAAQEQELAAAVAMYKALLYEKPARVLSLYTALELGFENSRPANVTNSE